MGFLATISSKSMRFRTHIPLLLIVAMSLHVRAERQQNATEGEPLPLPRWSKEEIQAFRENMDSLNSIGVLPPGTATPADINELLLGPITSGPRLDGRFPTPDGELSPRMQSEGMRFFLPESVLGTQESLQITGRSGPTPLSSLQAVTPEFLARAKLALPGEYLIDPDQLLSEVHQQDMTRFLEFHARDARIKLHVLAIAHDKRISDGTSLDAIASGALLKADSCLLIFPISEPWRARLFLSKNIHEQTSLEFLGETIQACLREALQSSDEHDQLRRYAVHLSTRLFWLQKALGEAPNLAKSVKQSVLAEVLAEKAAGTSVTNTSLTNHVIWTAIALLVVGLAGTLAHWFRLNQQAKHLTRVWILPENETLPRLGGAFTGGGGGMIRY
jgi:hypothetical protein